MRTWIACAVAVLGASLAWVIAWPAVAEAHTVSGEGASNYRTTVVGLRPAVGQGQGQGQGQGRGHGVGVGDIPVDIDSIGTFVEFRVVENGSRVRLAVRGDHTVEVGGYEDDAYLRLDRTGVWENAKSSAAYLNDSRRKTAATAPPSVVVDPNAEPQWARIAEPEDGQVVAVWHDHRVHWMSDVEPPNVRAAPGNAHRIYDWTVPLTIDGARVDAYGTLDWVPGPSPLSWVVLGAGLGVAVAACGLLRRRWGSALGVAVGTAVAVDVTHAALAAAGDADDPLGAFLWGNSVVALVWAVGLGAAVLLFRRSVTGLYLAATVGFVLALVGGFTDIGVLYRSGAPVAGPLDLTRATTAASIGTGLGLVAAVALANRRHRRNNAYPAGAARPEAAVPAEPVDAAPPSGVARRPSSRSATRKPVPARRNAH